MTSTTQTLSSLAEDARSQFTYTERGDETITVLKDDRADWVQKLAYDAHDDLLPDDWRFDKIADALEVIADSQAETVYDLDDESHEFADAAVGGNTHDRLAWLSSHLARSSYVDQAREDGLVGADVDLTDQIGIGQYAEAQEIFSSVADSLQSRLDDLEDDDS